MGPRGPSRSARSRGGAQPGALAPGEDQDPDAAVAQQRLAALLPLGAHGGVATVARQPLDRGRRERVRPEATLPALLSDPTQGPRGDALGLGGEPRAARLVELIPEPEDVLLAGRFEPRSELVAESLHLRFAAPGGSVGADADSTELGRGKRPRARRESRSEPAREDGGGRSAEPAGRGGADLVTQRVDGAAQGRRDLLELGRLHAQRQVAQREVDVAAAAAADCDAAAAGQGPVATGSDLTVLQLRAQALPPRRVSDENESHFQY